MADRCSKCDSFLNPGMKTCPLCGEPVAVSEKKEPVLAPSFEKIPETKPTPPPFRATGAFSPITDPAPSPLSAGAPLPPPMPEKPAEDDDANGLEQLQKRTKSPFFIVGAAFLCISVVMQIIMLILGYHWLHITPIADLFHSVFSPRSEIGTIICMLPTVLLAVSVWMCFASVISKKPIPKNTSGFTIIQLLLSIMLGICGVFAALFILRIFYSTVGGYAYYVLVPLLYLAVSALFIAYCICMLRSISAIKRTMLTGEKLKLVAPKLLTAVCVLCCVAVIAYIIFCGTSYYHYFTPTLYIPPNFMCAFSLAPLAISALCFGVQLQRLAKKERFDVWLKSSIAMAPLEDPPPVSGLKMSDNFTK